MARSFDSSCPGRAIVAIWRLLRRVVLGWRFVSSLERNKEAADRLDTALKEMVGEDPTSGG